MRTDHYLNKKELSVLTPSQRANYDAYLKAMERDQSGAYKDPQAFFQYRHNLSVASGELVKAFAESLWVDKFLAWISNKLSG